MMFPEMELENWKNILIFKIIAFQSGSSSSHIVEQDSSGWQSICYQASGKFKISLREVYSKASSLGVTKNIMKVLS